MLVDQGISFPTASRDLIVHENEYKFSEIFLTAVTVICCCSKQLCMSMHICAKGELERLLWQPSGPMKINWINTNGCICRGIVL